MSSLWNPIIMKNYHYVISHGSRTFETIMKTFPLLNKTSLLTHLGLEMILDNTNLSNLY